MTPTIKAQTVNQFLADVPIGRTKLYEEIAAGRLVAVKVGRRTLIRAEDAEAWLNSLPVAA